MLGITLGEGIAFTSIVIALTVFILNRMDLRKKTNIEHTRDLEIKVESLRDEVTDSKEREYRLLQRIYKLEGGNGVKK